MLQFNDPSLLIELKKGQAEYGYLTAGAMSEIAERLSVSVSRLYSVATFYSLLDTEQQARFTIRLCANMSCHLAGADDLVASASKMLGVRPGEITSDGMFGIETISCLGAGACGSGPAAMINERLYTHLNIEKLAWLISEIRDGRPVPAETALQERWIRALGNPAIIGSTVPAPSELLEGMAQEEVLTSIEASALRGRGGAAFPVGRKWRLCAEAPGDEKYIVCNADEGEPGTFKDRYLLTRHTKLVLAGMILAGHAVGARMGYIYLRAEYTDAWEAIQEEVSLIDPSVFDIRVFTGAGAYVCGEETALLESLEGRRGVPRLRPPYPPVCGLFGKPTVINNVETLANIPLIVTYGADWYRSLGTPQSTGTKLFCVSGDAAWPGIIEASLGVPLSDILTESGAGELKAVLVGGASGRLVPISEFGRQLCYEDLSPGAGAIICISKDRSMRKLAANLMAFFEHESCGECVPCRIGTARAREILESKLDPQGPTKNILQTLSASLVDTSRCGLGQTACVALLDALRWFPEEFEDSL